MNPVQANTPSPYDLCLLGPDSYKKNLYGLEFCCDVLMEAIERRLNKKSLNPAKS